MIRILLLVLLLSGCAHGERSAVTGQVTDVATTAVGLGISGVAEANPLGLLILPAKIIAHHRISLAPDEIQPGLWGIYGAVGWGASANNVCVIASVLSAGGFSLACPVVGLVTGLGYWRAGKSERERATFVALCEREKLTHPDLVCSYTPAGTTTN